MIYKIPTISTMKQLKQVTTKFINYKNGGVENLFVDERVIGVREGEYLMKVRAVGINRAECLHREGKYKVTRPEEAFLGLEAAGEVYDAETNVKLFDGIALLSGGSYSQWASVPKDHIMPLPHKLTYVEGGAIPQAWLTAFQLLLLAAVKQGDDVVIYAGASGVGTAVIQICKVLKANVFAVVSGEKKGKVCQQLGAKVVYYQNNAKWGEQLIGINGGKRFSVVLDCVGAQNYENTVDLLKVDGKWVLFGLLSGAKIDMNLGALLFKRINLISTTLKTRSHQYKTDLINKFSAIILPHFLTNQVKPVIFTTLKSDWTSADAFIEAQTLMEKNANYGKIMIQYI